ncbi:MAG: two-component system sensor histidine kinase CreC [Desulfobacterales bacterium]|nr:MAG: two-component system sensor histidine kinase CreC [Desulfobacterales bacterium]
MKISTKIFLCYLLINAVCFYYPFNWVLDSMRTRYLEGVEDPLVDQANTLAALVEYELEQGTFDPQLWGEIFNRAYRRAVDARIYKLLKQKVDETLYITDSKGVVIFHSENPEIIGADYSNWRDVTRTLRGEYGARTTRLEGGPEDVSVLYVAAPIILEGKIAGVLTIGKPTTNITWFVEQAKYQIIVMSLLSLLAAGILSYFLSRWITVPVNRLTRYARLVKDGQRTDFPKLGKGEVGEMGDALKEMKDALDGKQYVEQYIQNLTHEIKSPLSAIRGAAELLAESMGEQHREKFLKNIKNESLRIQDVIDRMLALSTLESRSELTVMGPVDVKALVQTVVESFEPVFSLKNIGSEVVVQEELVITGDSFLLHQALANLIQNSVDFSLAGGKVSVCARQKDDTVRISVCDQGTGIASFAENKIFEKFFSLQRPDTGQKSTGLGLNFVRQVALLHGGNVVLENRAGGGVEAVLTFPVSLT